MSNILSILIEIETYVVILENFEEISVNYCPIELTTYQINTFTNKISPQKLIISNNAQEVLPQFDQIT